MSKLIHFNTLNLNSINIVSPLNEVDKLSFALSYNNDPLMFFIDSLNVIKFTGEEIILDLRNNEHIKKLFDDLDTKVISDIQAKKVTKSYGLKGFTYIPLVSSYTNINNETFDVLKLKINLVGEFATSLFYKYGQPITDLNIMNEKVSVKTIVECIQIVFDKQNKFIYIDNCVRQLKVKQFRINRIKNLEYSFIDSDDEATIDKMTIFQSTLEKIYEHKESDKDTDDNRSNNYNDNNDNNVIEVVSDKLSIKNETEQQLSDKVLLKENTDKVLLKENTDKVLLKENTDKNKDVNDTDKITISENKSESEIKDDNNSEKLYTEKNNSDQEEDDEYTASIIKELNKLNNNSDIIQSDISDSETSEENF